MNKEGLLFSLFAMLMTLIIFVSIGCIILLVMSHFAAFVVAAVCDVLLIGAEAYLYTEDWF